MAESERFIFRIMNNANRRTQFERNLYKLFSLYILFSTLKYILSHIGNCRIKSLKCWPLHHHGNIFEIIAKKCIHNMCLILKSMIALSNYSLKEIVPLIASFSLFHRVKKCNFCLNYLMKYFRNKLL